MSVIFVDKFITQLLSVSSGTVSIVGSIPFISVRLHLALCLPLYFTLRLFFPVRLVALLGSLLDVTSM